MDKLKKKTLRIAICLAAFLAVFIVDKVCDLNIWLRPVLFAAVFLGAGYDVLYKSVSNIAHGKVFDENFLMTVASVGAFALGVVETVNGGVGDFAESAAVMLFYQVGELFQDYAVGKSRKSIAALMDIRPEKARVLRGGELVEVYPEEVTIGETVEVRAGEKIPLDGKVVKGHANLNTRALTGESAPVFIEEGSCALSGTIVLDGTITVSVEKEYYDGTVAKILDMVENASGKKAKTENFISAFAKYYTPIVVFSAIALAVLPSLVFAVLGQNVWVEWITRALTFLVVSCPCALVISVPLGFFGGIGGASGKGILIKGAEYIERLAKVDVVAFDKTGTLTKGEFKVCGVYPEDRRDEILRVAYICESQSNHPVAKSITDEVGGIACDGYYIEEIAGKGVKAELGEEVLLCGNVALMREFEVNIGAEDESFGGTTVYVAKNGEYLGKIRVADTIKDEARGVIDKLKKDGVKVIMLTGDNESAARPVADALGVSEYASGLLPQDKLARIERELALKGKNDVVAFVGDGINDAPVLMRSDVGVSMGAVGSDSAVEASDVVLMYDDLNGIVTARRVAKKTMRLVKENVVFSLVIKFATLILSAFGLTNMWMAVFADVGVAVLAILNSMRALKIK